MRPVLIGLNSATEQYSPPELVERGLAAHKSGFDSFWVSDHFHPWFHTGAHSSFAWEVLAATAVKSDRLVLGTSVTSPIFRYNPAIVAQAFATLSWLAPGRIFLGVATGEGLNEVPCGYDWPRSHAERIDRLREAVTIIRLLWTKEFVTFAGEHFKLNRANLYDKPPVPIPLHLSGFGPRAAELAGEIADAFMTVGPTDASRVEGVLFPAVERGARSCGRRMEDVEKSLVLGLAFHSDREKAIDSLLPWRGSLLPVFADSDVHDPRKIEENGNRVGRDSLERYFVVATSPEDVISAVERHVELGFDHVALALSGDLPAFVKAAKKDILPYLREEYEDRQLNRAEYRGSYGYGNLERLMEVNDLVHKIGSM